MPSGVWPVCGEVERVSDAHWRSGSEDFEQLMKFTVGRCNLVLFCLFVCL